MGQIQHGVITDPNIHEPKGASTAAAGQIYVATGTGSGTWKSLSEADLDMSNPANNAYGWNDISDSQFTVGAPRAIASATRTRVTNNGLATQSNTTRLGPIWSSANNEFSISDLNAMYVLRVTFKLKAAAAASTPYNALIELEGGSPVFTFAGQTHFVKGGSAVNQYSISFPFYIGASINSLPIKVFITADTAVDMYDVGFLIQRVYREV